MSEYDQAFKLSATEYLEALSKLPEDERRRKFNSLTPEEKADLIKTANYNRLTPQQKKAKDAQIPIIVIGLSFFAAFVAWIWWLFY